ncbi:MAG TPA: monovalent cation:proton antiporter-2 (CPA2) family protein [Candidatus Binatia bacterium]|nr:monovalent cation:proton antiporter-2 (CPA2) family protein [Candidatus Binatia bacterium]
MLADIALFLAAAVIAVPLAQRLGLGAVIGYLVAGIAIGPSGLALVTDVQSILDFSEFGVVLLLFVIGLELQPSRLWRLRVDVFGLGGAQVLLGTLVFGLAATAAGLPPVAAAVTGFGLSMSSTALVLRLLADRGELDARHGRAAFAVLLFQDLAVIPFIALLPLLSGGQAGLHWPDAARALAAIAGVVVLGRTVLRPALRRLAAANVPEIFTAAALLVVIATALGMQAAGLSMSLGAFLAGVLLAESEFRHELQADIEPFKGLLLGLFFIAVGMSVNLGLVASRPAAVLALLAGLVALKTASLYALGRLARLPAAASRAFAAALAAGGEFAFVLFALAGAAGLLAADTRELLVLAVSLSMLLTPALYRLQARFQPATVGPAFDAIDAPPAPVLLAGFGPFGQIVGRLLRVKKIPFTVLEKSWEQVDVVRRFGSTIYYGDAARLDLLRAARADRAALFVITIANAEISLQIAETVRRHFPQLRVFAVAQDRNHALRLMDLGITDVVRRAYFSSLELSRRVLVTLGESEPAAARAITTFRSHDEATLLKQQAVYRDETQLIQSSQAAARELEQLFESDRPDTVERAA